MRRREVIQDVALLLLQRRHHRQHALDKARAVLALGAKTALAPLYTRTDGTFGRIVRGLHPFNLHEGPQRLRSEQQTTALKSRSHRVGSDFSEQKKEREAL